MMKIGLAGTRGDYKGLGGIEQGVGWVVRLVVRLGGALVTHPTS